MATVSLVLALLAAPEPKELFLAISKGDAAAVKALLEQGVDLKATSPPSDFTPLHLAVIYKRPEIAALLLAKGVDPNALDVNGHAPLRKAATEGQLEMVRVLLEKGANTEAGTGPTPLLLAVWSNHMDVAALLAEKGATLDVYTAAGLGRTEKLRELLAASPGLAKARMDEGDTPLTYAARGGHKDACAMLLAGGADPNAIDREFRRPIDRAGSPEVVDLLVDKGVDVNATLVRYERHLPTPLAYAADEGRVAVVERLIDRGARVPWMVACAALDADRADLVLMLLRKGWAPTGIESFDLVVRTLDHAARKGRKDLFDPILKGCGDLDAARNNGWTMLHYAAQWNFAAAIPVLVAKGAKLQAGDEWQRAPLAVAASNGSKDALLALLDAGAKVDARDVGEGTALHWCAGRRDSATLVAALLAKGAAACVNMQRTDGGTPLHAAAVAGSAETARLLVEKGADVRIRNKQGQTPADVAATNLNTDVADYLKSLK